MMNTAKPWYSALTALAAACMLVACGGGGGNAPVATPTGMQAPALTGNIATDGRLWINYRRAQVGVAALTQSGLIDKAAQSHSDYQQINNIVSHDEVIGKSGYTGVHLLERLASTGYAFGNAAYAYGEVISATSNNSGAYMADELITAIYHRFVIFEPMFKEIGTGSATTARGYTYFTTDFTANNGYGAGLGRGNVVTWPFSGQTQVAPNFFSDNEAPDPVADVNEVGYPVSVHADISAQLTVERFTISERGGVVLASKLLVHASDPETPASAASIVPLAVLKGATIHDVSFSGKVDGVAVTKNWSFTTR